MAVVNLTAPSGYFGNDVTLLSAGTGTVAVTLADSVTGETGPGTYEVGLVSNQLDVFGTGTAGPAIHVIKGSFPGDRRILRGWQFTVDETDKVIGSRDIRTYGGISTSAIQNGAVTKVKLAGDLQFSDLADVQINDATLVNGDVPTWNATDHKWEAVIGAAARFDSLADTNFTDASVTDGSFPKYSAATGKWVTSTSIGYLRSLLDVTVSATPPTGALLQWNGGTWVAGNDGQRIYVGSGVPSSGTGVAYDLYINSVNGDLYQKGGDGVTWIVVANIQGPQGIQGIQGNPGIQGTPGAASTVPGPAGAGVPPGLTWTTGIGAPTSTQPVGSLYSRADGAVGTTLYVSHGGASWSAFA